MNVERFWCRSGEARNSLMERVSGLLGERKM